MTCCEIRKAGRSLVNFWSFNDALGDTIMEKYEGLYGVLFSIFTKNGGPLSIICGQDVGSIFETATYGWSPEERYNQVGGGGFYRLGRVNRRFDVYIDLSLTTKIYVNGQTGTEVLNIEDFVI